MKSSRGLFIVHPSPVLTDFQAHGDGLLTYRFICELANRGYRVSVACETVRLAHPLPPNVSVFPIELHLRRFGIWARLEYAVKMRRLFERLDRKERFDIAHQLNPVFAGLSLGLLGKNVPLVLGPYVSHWSSSRSSRWKSALLDIISALQQRFADAILISGPAARSRIVSKSVRDNKVFSVPYGIDLAMFPSSALPPGDPVVLYLAGLSEHKGISVLLTAFELLGARVPNVRLVVAGDGPCRDRVRAMVAASPFSDRITLVGSVARQDVPALLASCTVYCLASFGEPYGMSLIEAMASGRPAVATDVGGPVDLLKRDGGFLVTPGDVAALAAVLETIVMDARLARSMGASNRAAVEQYAWPKVIDRLEAVYDAVLARRPDRQGLSAASQHSVSR